jgi:hypothetical protein
MPLLLEQVEASERPGLILFFPLLLQLVVGVAALIQLVVVEALAAVAAYLLLTLSAVLE